MDGIKPPRRRPIQKGIQQSTPQKAPHGTGSVPQTRPSAIRRPSAGFAPPSNSAPRMRPASPSHGQSQPQQPVARPVTASAPAQRAGQPKETDTKSWLKRFSRKTYIIAGVVIGLLLLLLTWLLLASWAYGLREINYNNGQEAHYTMDFYRRSSTGKSIGSTKLVSLVSEVSKSGKEPLTVTIMTLPNKPDDAAIFCYNNGDKKFSVKNIQSTKDIYICPAGQTGNFTMYSAVFESGGKWHQFTARQDVNVKNEDDTDPSAVIAKRSGVSPYRSDIETMLKSVTYQK